MAKSRKRIFPKPPERLNSKNAVKLGTRSNKVCYEATLLGVYTQPVRNETKPLSEQQKRMLANLKKNLGYTYQPE